MTGLRSCKIQLMFKLYLCLVNADEGPQPIWSKSTGVDNIFDLRDGAIAEPFRNAMRFSHLPTWKKFHTTYHSVLNQGFLYTNFDFFYKTSQTVLLVLTFIDMMFEQEAVPVS